MRAAIKQRCFLSHGRQLLADLGEFARDVSDAFGKLVALERIAFTAVYSEPMTIGVDHEPDGLLAIRVRQDASPEAAVNGSARVPFVWNGNKRELQVSSVDGCTVGVKYRFTFLAVG